MEQQFVIIHRHTILQDNRKKTWQILNRPTADHVMFYAEIYKDKKFCSGYKILTDGVCCNPPV